MKKILLALFALCMSAGAFAQYQGTTWGSDLLTFQTQKGLFPNKQQDNYRYCTEKKLMLGQPSELFYIFENSKLAGISYQVDYSPETEKKLLDNLQEFSYKKIEEHKRNKELDPADKGKIQAWKNFNNKKFEILFFDEVNVYSRGGETSTNDFINNKGLYTDNSFYIYKYSNHTMIYIYSNILYNDKIVIVYVPQAEDF